jgi:hypothetical protein
VFKGRINTLGALFAAFVAVALVEYRAGLCTAMS